MPDQNLTEGPKKVFYSLVVFDCRIDLQPARMILYLCVKSSKDEFIAGATPGLEDVRVVSPAVQGVVVNAVG